MRIKNVDLFIVLLLQERSNHPWECRTISVFPVMFLGLISPCRASRGLTRAVVIYHRLGRQSYHSAPRFWYWLSPGAQISHTTAKARLDRQNRWLVIPFLTTTLLVWFVSFRIMTPYDTNSQFHTTFHCQYSPGRLNLLGKFLQENLRLNSLYCR